MSMPIDWQIDFYRREMERQQRFWNDLVQRGRMQPARRDRNVELVNATLATLQGARDAQPLESRPLREPVRPHCEPAEGDDGQ